MAERVQHLLVKRNVCQSAMSMAVLRLHSASRTCYRLLVQRHQGYRFDLGQVQTGRCRDDGILVNWLEYADCNTP